MWSCPVPVIVAWGLNGCSRKLNERGIKYKKNYKCPLHILQYPVGREAEHIIGVALCILYNQGNFTGLIFVVRWKPQKLDPQKFPANLFTIFYMIFISRYTYKSPKMLIYSVALRLLDSIRYLIYENVVTMNIMLLCS